VPIKPYDWDDPGQALRAWGVDVTFTPELASVARQLHRSNPARLSDEDVNRVAERVVEALDRAITAHDDRCDVAVSGVKAAERRRTLKAAAYDLGMAVMGSGAWELLVWLAHHGVLLLDSDGEDEGMRTRERQRARIRETLEREADLSGRTFLSEEGNMVSPLVLRALHGALFAQLEADPRAAETITALRPAFEARGADRNSESFFVDVALEELVWGLTSACGEQLLAGA